MFLLLQVLTGSRVLSIMFGCLVRSGLPNNLTQLSRDNVNQSALDLGIHALL